MALKDLLLQLSSYPEPTPLEPIGQAVSFAELLGARLSALTFEIDIHVPSNPLAVTVLDIPAMIAAEESKSANNAKDLVNAFSAAAEKQGVASISSSDARPRGHGCLAGQARPLDSGRRSPAPPSPGPSGYSARRPAQSHRTSP